MNLIEIGLAFVEGLALILSPCILPVLPLVLATSVEGGKRRPYGIIIGFVLSFSLFVLASRKLVALLGLDLDLIKNGSLILLVLFGLILLSSKLSAKFSALTQGAANLGNQLASSSSKDGLLSGIVIGSMIGLVWTPCSGPILAAVLVQVIRQQTDVAGYFIILSFAIGAGVPMLIIALTGRKIMQRLGFFTRHAEGVRKAFGVLIILSVIYIASGVDAQTLLSSRQNVPTTGNLALQEDLAQPYPAPEFAGIETWLNSPPLTMQSLKGKVVL
ncbi:MAG: cytochrome c biogenesis protein/redoxin, partial [Gallionellaceae bacterium]|nr:cytochrome c biogenesis protein/redoxin [Gallionellaceae bacterium]